MEAPGTQPKRPAAGTRPAASNIPPRTGLISGVSRGRPRSRSTPSSREKPRSRKTLPRDAVEFDRADGLADRPSALSRDLRRMTTLWSLEARQAQLQPRCCDQAGRGRAGPAAADRRSWTTDDPAAPREGEVDGRPRFEPIGPRGRPVTPWSSSTPRSGSTT
jgi:hypothetical protein